MGGTGGSRDMIPIMETGKNIENEPFVIPTAYRAKIAHTLAFPIGAEALSKAFAELPQFTQFEVSFASRQWRRSNVVGDVLCLVLTVSYRRSGTSLTTGEWAIKHGFLEPRWQITVHPVFRTIKHKVRTSLEKAMPGVCSWLLANSTAETRLGNLELTLTYNETDDNMSSEVAEKLEPERMG